MRRSPRPHCVASGWPCWRGTLLWVDPEPKSQRMGSAPNRPRISGGRASAGLRSVMACSAMATRLQRVPSGVWRRESERAAAGAHGVGLVGENAEIGARQRPAQQDVAGITVLIEVLVGAVVLDSAGKQFGGAAQAAALMAHSGQGDIVACGCVPDVFVFAAGQGAEAVRSLENDLEGLFISHSDQFRPAEPVMPMTI